MVSFIILLSVEVTDDVSCVLQTLEQNGPLEVVKSVCVLYKHKEKEVGDVKAEKDRNVSWLSLDQISAHLITNGDVSSGVCDLKRTTEQLHDIADSLPVAGAVVDMFIWPPADTDDSDYIQFLGALRRLKDWHNAKVSLFDRDPTPDTEFLQKFLSADIYIQPENYKMLETPSLLWRGKVSICDKFENKGLTVPGVSLYRIDASTPALNYPVISHNKNISQVGCVLGRMLEVLDEVALGSIPALMKTPHVYKLCLYQKHPYAQVFMNYIQQNTQTGMLARLPVYPDHTDSLTCGEVGLSTDAWKENIIADVQYVQEPEEDLQDNYEFLYFIITSPDQHDAVEHFVAYAHLLQHPYNLNSALVSKMALHAMCPLRGGNKEEFDLSSLPSLSWTTLRCIEHDIVVLQRAMLRKLIDERRSKGQSIDIDPGDLISSLTEVRMKYINTLAGKLHTSNTEHTQSTLQLKQEVYEVSENSCEWPERLVQQYMESQKRCLSRIQSSESMPMSSPVQPCEGTPSNIDIESFLQYFQADGSASITDMSPIRRRHPTRAKNRLSQPETSSPHLTGWPESKDVMSHDVYYNVDKRTEKINTHFNRLQEKMVKNETFSSCLSTQVLFPRATKKQPESGENEPRRSPRKKVPRSIFDENAPVAEEVSKTRVKGRLFDTKAADSGSSRRFSTPTALPPKQRRRDSSLPSKDVNPQRRNSDIGLHPVQKQVDKLRRESVGDTSFTSQDGQGQKKESRSERHKRRLQSIVDTVLADNGVNSSDPIYKSCSMRLFKVTKLFVMDLPNSRNLKEEMMKIAQSQVLQVIEVDRMRQQSL